MVRAADATCVLLADGQCAVRSGPNGQDDQGGMGDAGFDTDLQRENGRFPVIVDTLIIGS